MRQTTARPNGSDASRVSASWYQWSSRVSFSKPDLVQVARAMIHIRVSIRADVLKQRPTAWPRRLSVTFRRAPPARPWSSVVLTSLLTTFALSNGAVLRLSLNTLSMNPASFGGEAHQAQRESIRGQRHVDHGADDRSPCRRR